MAEFQDVMRDWSRMCGSAHGCDDCRLRAIKDLCLVEPGDQTDWAAVEKAVDAWVAEHPEPVYPRWIDWLADVGLIINTADHYAFNFTAAADQIPADIAEKLGIESKE